MQLIAYYEAKSCSEFGRVLRYYTTHIFSGAVAIRIDRLILEALLLRLLTVQRRQRCGRRRRRRRSRGGRQTGGPRAAKLEAVYRGHRRRNGKRTRRQLEEVGANTGGEMRLRSLLGWTRAIMLKLKISISL